MNDTETVLTDYLHRTAARIEPGSRLTEIEDGAIALRPAQRLPGVVQRFAILGGAAAAAAVMIAVVWTGLDGSNRPLDVATDDATAPSAESGNGSPVRTVIGAAEGAPTVLADGAVVLVAPGVGRVEVGAPPAELLAEHGWPAGLHCVAAAGVVGCAPNGPSADNGSYAATSREGYVVSGRSADEPLFVIGDPKGGGVAILTLLPADAVEVEARLGAAHFTQEPAHGTVAFPLEEGVREVTLSAFGADGQILWHDGFDLPTAETGAGPADEAE